MTGRPLLASAQAGRVGAASIDATAATIQAEFAALEDWSQRSNHLLEIGRKSEGISPAERRETDKVVGCQSQVWLTVRESEGMLLIRADSDALIMRGLLALVLRLYSRRYAEEITAHTPDALVKQIGTCDLAPSRSNGLRLIVTHIHHAAVALQARTRATFIAEG